MNIAIVEDDQVAKELLLHYFQQYETDFKVSFNITTFSDGIEIVDKYQSQFDVIYFDVEMPIMSGMAAAKKIRALDDSVSIVFITNYVKWAIEGYSVNASDFLLKPITYFNLKEHLNKLLQKLAHQGRKHIMLKTSAGIRKIDLAKIFYIESDGHYLNFHLQDEQITILDSLKNYDQKLKEEDFYRCNNPFLVNLAQVKAVDQNTVILNNDSELQISRPRKKGFLTALSDYLEGTLR